MCKLSSTGSASGAQSGRELRGVDQLKKFATLEEIVATKPDWLWQSNGRCVNRLAGKEWCMFSCPFYPVDRPFDVDDRYTRGKEACDQARAVFMAGWAANKALLVHGADVKRLLEMASVRVMMFKRKLRAKFEAEHVVYTALQVTKEEGFSSAGFKVNLRQKAVLDELSFRRELISYQEVYPIVESVPAEVRRQTWLEKLRLKGIMSELAVRGELAGYQGLSVVPSLSSAARFELWLSSRENVVAKSMPVCCVEDVPVCIACGGAFLRGAAYGCGHVDGFNRDELFGFPSWFLNLVVWRKLPPHRWLVYWKNRYGWDDVSIPMGPVDLLPKDEVCKAVPRWVSALPRELDIALVENGGPTFGQSCAVCGDLRLVHIVQEGFNDEALPDVRCRCVVNTPRVRRYSKRPVVTGSCGCRVLWEMYVGLYRKVRIRGASRAIVNRVDASRFQTFCTCSQRLFFVEFARYYKLPVYRWAGPEDADSVFNGSSSGSDVASDDFEG